jgi:hypothetical protein
MKIYTDVFPLQGERFVKYLAFVITELPVFTGQDYVRFQFIDNSGMMMTGYDFKRYFDNI